MRRPVFRRVCAKRVRQAVWSLAAVAVTAVLVGSPLDGFAADPIHQHPGFGKPEPRVHPDPRWLDERFGSQTPVGIASQLVDQGWNQWRDGRTIQAEQSLTAAVLHDPEVLMGYLGLALVHDRYARHHQRDGRLVDHEMHRRLASQALAMANRYVDSTNSPREAELFRLTHDEWVGRSKPTTTGEAAWQTWVEADPDDRWRTILRDRWKSSLGETGGIETWHPPIDLGVDAALEQSSVGWTHPADVPGWTATMLRQVRESLGRGHFLEAQRLAEALLRMPRPITDASADERSDYRLGHALAAVAALAHDRQTAFDSAAVRAAIAKNLTADDVVAVSRDWKAALAVADACTGDEESSSRLRRSLLRQRAMRESTLLGFASSHELDPNSSARRTTRGEWIRLWTSNSAALDSNPNRATENHSSTAGLRIAQIHSPKFAPNWGVRDADGGVVFAEQYADRPVLMLFYLGAGCLHCVEQVQKFEQRYEDFAAAGIEVIAISSETAESLRQSLDAFGQPLRIELLSNADGEVFDAFGCMDPLTGEALHGTFFVMPGGRVGFWDIGVEPVLDVDAVLRECRRQQALFRFDGPAPEPTNR